MNAAPIAELYGNDDALVKATRRARNHRSKARSALHTLRYARPGRRARTKLGHIKALVASGAAGAAQLTELRCERGANIASGIGLSEETADAIRCLDEHWDGGGYPYGRAGEEIPLLGRVMCLAQTLEIYWEHGGPAEARSMAAARSGTWFDPALVEVVTAAGDRDPLWEGLDEPDVTSVEPASAAILVDERRLDAIADAFGQIDDAKTPYNRTALAGRGAARGARGTRDGARRPGGPRVSTAQGSCTISASSDLQPHFDKPASSTMPSGRRSRGTRRPATRFSRACPC